VKTLVLTEKPETARDMAKGLNVPESMDQGWFESDAYVITWAYGHLLELCPPEAYDPRLKKWDLTQLPILPDDFRYQVARYPQQMKTLRQLIGREDVGHIVLATDAGREGELIGRLILDHVACCKPLWRFWTSASWQPEIIREGFAHLRPASEFDALYCAALARQQADWLVGINASRALTIRANLPGMTHAVGRVKTPTLAMIVRREQEIEQFQPVPYWRLKGHFAHAGDEFSAGWLASADSRQPESAEELPESSGNEPEGDKLADEFAANRIINRLCSDHAAARPMTNGRQFFPLGKEPAFRQGVVIDVQQTVKRVPPPALFSLATLQQEASRQLGFDLETTEQLTQQLYQTHKIISYPRTESQVLGEEMVNAAAAILATLRQRFEIGDLRLAVDPGNRRVFDSARLVEGHHAIIPNGHEGIALTEQERALYALIVKRFVAAFCPPYAYVSRRVLLSVRGELFQGTCTWPSESGWKVYYTGKALAPRQRGPLDQIKAGETVEFLSATLSEHRTEPPDAYTDASLLNDMLNAEKFVTDEQIKAALGRSHGIGTAATRGKLIRELVERGYVVRRNKALKPTKKAMTLIAAIGDGPLADPGWTAYWEAQLTRMAKGEGGSLELFLTEIKSQVRQFVENARTVEERVLDFGTPLGTCPACAGEVREQGDRYACSQAPRCRFVIYKDQLRRLGKAHLSSQEVTQLLTGLPLPLVGLRDRAGQEFNSQGTLERHARYGWRIALSSPGSPRPVHEAIACACSPLPPITVEEPRPGLFDSKVLALAAGTYLDALQQRKTHKHMNTMIEALLQAGVPPSQDVVCRHLRAHGVIAETLDTKSLPQPYAVLCEAHHEMSGVWVMLNHLQARYSPQLRVAVKDIHGRVEGEIVASLPDSGHYRVFLDEENAVGEEQLFPWESVFCLSCGQHGLSSSRFDE